MKTNAETIKILQKNSKKLGIIVPDFLYTEVKNFKKNKIFFLNQINKKFKYKPIIIRSSSKNEDTRKFTNAGKYDSIILKKYSDSDIIKSINSIIKKFKNSNDQIIIQNLIKNTKYAGVIFTRNINNLSPYYIINYDSSGKTDVITSGKKDKTIKTLIVHKDKIKNTNQFKSVLKKIKKIETFFNNDFLDIEFAIRKNSLIIFQCRPLHNNNLQKEKNNDLDKNILENFINIKKKFSKLQKTLPDIIGEYTLFSNMADWNPAEMIGVKPSNLSLSLYSELITDEAWAIQRTLYGYKDVRPNPLMVTIAGSPYIDVRVDFNSFLPVSLDKKISKKILNYTMKKLSINNGLHDKVEFELLETCYDINSKQNVDKYLNKKESKIYLNLLKQITNRVIFKQDLLRIELDKLKKLDSELENIKNLHMSPIQKIYFLVNNCKHNGVIPFAGLARSAFIVTKILKSLNLKNIINNKELQNFYSSIDSVTRDINNLYLISKKKNNYKDFLSKYGHIRPSTYSIDSLNYSENFKKFFGKNLSYIKKGTFNLKKSKIKQINKIFKQHGLKFNCDMFFNFAKKVIFLRETSKLKFTISINEIFKEIRKLSRELNISKENLKHISIKDLLYYYNNLETDKLRKTINQKIKNCRHQFQVTDKIEFPNLIKNFNDFYVFEKTSFEGNFITVNECYGELIKIDKKNNNKKNLNNKIVIIESADPGYDYIFTYKIKGLITKYGGANSHMSIRCMELNIPAVIGIGRFDYEKIVNSNNLYLNCKDKILKIFN